MTIEEIKSKLTLSQVLHYYHLKPDKNLRLNCPFHEDKTPSLQVYYKTHTAYCFSTNCKTHGKSLDVIDFIMHKENVTKHEAIMKAKEMIGGKAETTTLTRIAVLTKMFTYFKNGVHNSKPAKEYIEQRGLSYDKSIIGYNSGQFHHGKRKDEALIKSCIKYGLLLDLGTKSRTGEAAYKPFGKWSIVFPMKNKKGRIVSLYFRSTRDVKGQKHYYLKDRQGLYPNYPGKETKKLILTECIIDAASLMEQEQITKEYEILSLYGTNGLTEEHQKAIAELTDLEEIVMFFDGDKAGREAISKYAPMLKQEKKHVQISYVDTPDGEDVNSLLQGHSPEILNHMIETRKEYDFLFSSEKSGSPDRQLKITTEKEQTEVLPIKRKRGLDTSNPYNLVFEGRAAKYQVKGFRVSQPDSLKVTIQINRG